MRSYYRIVHHNEASIVLEDQGRPWTKFKSVTNDIEKIVEELHIKGYLGDRKLSYIDSEGQLTRVIHKDGKFIAFGE